MEAPLAFPQSLCILLYFTVYKTLFPFNILLNAHLKGEQGRDYYYIFHSSKHPSSPLDIRLVAKVPDGSHTLVKYFSLKMYRG